MVRVLVVAAIDVSQSQLSVEPVLTARDMVQETVDHIGKVQHPDRPWVGNVGESAGTWWGGCEVAWVGDLFLNYDLFSI